jgi:hypothetical protein
MFYKKRAQAEIITTVLIILLVLAAIVIVWQVVKSTVQSGGEQVSTQSDCLGLNLAVVGANSTTIVLRRDPGANKQVTVDAILFVNGVSKGVTATGLRELDSATNATLTGLGITGGSDIQLAGKLAGGTLCPLGPIREAVTGSF